MLLAAKSFPNPAFPSIAYHRTPHPPGNHHTQSRPIQLVGSGDDHQRLIRNSAALLEHTVKIALATQTLMLAETFRTTHTASPRQTDHQSAPKKLRPKNIQQGYSTS